MKKQMKQLLEDPFISNNFDYKYKVNRLISYYDSLPSKLSYYSKKWLIYHYILELDDEIEFIN
jgi:hypothetical protein